MTKDQVLIQLDFSENYSYKYESEEQSFHFGGSTKQVTLHTNSLSFRDDDYGPLKTKSFCTLSESLNHGPSAIIAHLKPVFNYLKTTKPSLKGIHFLSDSPSSQYRNKALFYVFSNLNKQIFPSTVYSSWNYYEAGYDTGKPDGIGGTVKRSADRLVAEGKDVDKFELSIDFLKQNLMKIEIIIKEETDSIRRKS